MSAENIHGHDVHMTTHAISALGWVVLCNTAILFYTVIYFIMT